MSLESNFHLITSRIQYSQNNYEQNGFYISNLYNNNEALSLVSSLLNKIEESNILNTKIKENVFNETRTPELSKGRFMIPFDKLKSKSKRKPIYADIGNLTQEIGGNIINIINNDLGYNIDLSDLIPTIMETKDNKTLPQLIHCDMAYDEKEDEKIYEEQALVMVALQVDSAIRIIVGSHNFLTQSDYQNNYNNDKFQFPSVIYLNKGEFIVMHPKLFHSGWSALANNVRLHFYVGLTKLFNESHHISDQITFFLDTETYKNFDGTKRKSHCETMSLKYHNLKRLKKQFTAEIFTIKKLVS